MKRVATDFFTYLKKLNNYNEMYGDTYKHLYFTSCKKYDFGY